VGERRAIRNARMVRVEVAFVAYCDNFIIGWPSPNSSLVSKAALMKNTEDPFLHRISKHECLQC
jgi:hypothetical protein